MIGSHEAKADYIWMTLLPMLEAIEPLLEAQMISQNPDHKQRIADAMDAIKAIQNVAKDIHEGK